MEIDIVRTRSKLRVLQKDLSRHSLENKMAAMVLADTIELEKQIYKNNEETILILAKKLNLEDQIVWE